MGTQLPPTPKKWTQQSPRFGSCALWPDGRPSQQLLCSCCITDDRESILYNACQNREWVDGSWVTGQMGHENRMGHMGHGSLGVDPWPISFYNSMAGLICCDNDNISCQSVMHVQLCMWLTKFQVHVHIQVHASRAAAGTPVPVGYPGNKLPG